jgi:uncharacterized YigZ family protein
MFLEPRNSVQARLEVKKSRFIACAQQARSREQAMVFIAEIKQTFPDARHICWGYLIGDPNNSTQAGCHDDGEPSGTAGKPILSQIQYSQIGNVVVGCVRYFGGIRLGAGGLVRAYREAAQLALKSLETDIYQHWIEYKIECDFADEHHVRQLLDDLKGEISNLSYQGHVAMTLLVPEVGAPALETRLEGLGIRINRRS